MSGRHGWNSWQGYLDVHRGHLSRYLGHFVVDDQLSYTLTLEHVQWSGIVHCVGGLEIHVSRLQQTRMRRGRLMVRTTQYSYHVLQRVGARAVLLFRYDNVHVHSGHPDPHHVHRYDDCGERIEHVGEERWPTLGDVIDELYTWYGHREDQQG